jgi:hypothetical protein
MRKSADSGQDRQRRHVEVWKRQAPSSDNPVDFILYRAPIGGHGAV